MAQNLVRATLVADAKGWGRGFKEAEQSSAGFERKVQGVATAVKGFLAFQAVQAVKDFALDVKNSYSELEQATGGVQSVFGELADSIIESSREAADAVGLSESAYQTLATRLGGMLQNMGFDLEEATSKTKELIVTGADMAATYGGSVSEAVSAIAALLRGERDPIERYAVSFKQADINARAMAMGLGEGGKAAATLDLLMQQTAKTTGQFGREAGTTAGKEQRLNAELENQKALLGQGITPLYLGLLEIARDLIPILTDVAYGFGEITGAINAVEAAQRQLNETMGEDAPRSAEGLLTAFTEMTVRGSGAAQLLENLQLDFLTANWRQGQFAEGMETLRETMRGMSADELVKARAGLADTAKQMGWNEEQTQALADTIDNELSRRMAESADRVQLGKYKPALEEVEGATEDVEEATKDATDAVQDYIDTQRAAVDPIFGVMKANQDATEAQAAYKEAVDKYGESSLEAALASQGIVDANVDLQSSLHALRVQGIDPTGDAARSMFRGMGLTDAQIDAIFAQFQRIEDNAPVVRASITMPDIHSVTSGQGVNFYKGKTRTYTEHGGIARARPGGVDITTAEAGSDEAVIPLESAQGIEALAAALRKAGGGGASGSPIVVQVQGSVVTEQDLVEAIHRGLLEKQRRSGNLGLV